MTALRKRALRDWRSTGSCWSSTTQRSGKFDPLRFIPKTKQVVLGLITTKTPQLENKSDVLRRIDDATRFIDADQLSVSPQCGFASVVEGNLITPEDQLAKLRLVVEIASELWGD